MKKTLIIITVAVLISALSCKKAESGEPGSSDNLPRLFESEEGKFGYKDASGKTVIEPQFVMATEFSPEGTAYAVSGFDWICIDTAGKKLVKMFNYDNGPDYFEEGLARYEDESGKMGFVNKKCEVMIPARFDFAWPFENGKAQVCDGCTKTREHEMLKVTGGNNYSVNKKGEVVKN